MGVLTQLLLREEHTVKKSEICKKSVFFFPSFSRVQSVDIVI